ncbi:MAG: hypothetical protein KC478_11885, partial [Bacteriovoracaceae bacterium]|nr:hypothetical protein [Bacteriovoracaceae bacterium]
EQAMTVDGPYIPRHFTNFGNEIFQATDNCKNYLQDAVTKWGVSVYLPTYIGARADGAGVSALTESNITSIQIRLMDSSGNEVATIPAVNQGIGACFNGTNPMIATGLGDAPAGDPNSGAGPNMTGDPDPNAVDAQYCLEDDPSPGVEATILHVAVNPTAPAGAATWAYAGIRINYQTLNSASYRHESLPTCDATPGGAGTTQCDNGMEPGNALYYLTKLARLELLGVPQIFYEPLYCNSNRSRLVGGIFDIASSTREAFDAISIDYDPNVNVQSLEQIYTDAVTGADGSHTTAGIDENLTNHLNGKITFQDKVSLPQIFSGHEFKCCIELGEKTPDSSKCCSNFSTIDNAGDRTCKLPQGTNLNVYFNKFISSEGIGEEKPAGGLVEDDFVPVSGEPKLNLGVNNKLIALGQEYCASGSTRKGAAFGYFYGEPNNGSFIQINNTDEDSKRFSIIDSTNDLDGDNASGFNFFQQGLRWDHHFYCN